MFLSCAVKYILELYWETHPVLYWEVYTERGKESFSPYLGSFGKAESQPKGRIIKTLYNLGVRGLQRWLSG